MGRMTSSIGGPPTEKPTRKGFGTSDWMCLPDKLPILLNAAEPKRRYAKVMSNFCGSRPLSSSVKTES